MKNILFILFLLINNRHICHENGRSATEVFSISIVDYNPSLAYSNEYHIDNDSLRITFFGGLEGESEKKIFDRKLLKDESGAFYKYITSRLIDTLKNEYTNPYMLDGDDKKVVLQVKNRKKTIQIYNYYLKEIDSLFQMVNNFVPRKMMIVYTDRTVKKPGK